MSFYGQPGRGAFSAADAYASLPSQHSIASPPTADSLPTAAAIRDSYYDSQAAAAVSGPHVRRGDVERGRGAQHDDDDDDDEDEDWNVYDDFNNARPVSTAQGLTDPGAWTRDSREFSSVNIGGGPGGAGARPFSGYSTATTAAVGPGGNRKSLKPGQALISPDAFGFDVQNSDPRRSYFARQASAGIPGLPSSYDPMHSTPGLGGGSTPGGMHGHAKEVNNASGIELITVPALGTEFTEDEMKHMRRPHKRRVKRAARAKKVKSWAKGEEKFFGIISGKMLAIGGFIFCIVLALLLYFVIPRVPIYGLSTLTPVSAVPNSEAMTISYNPTSFKMTMKLNLRADNRGGYIPSSAYDLTADITDLTTNIKVGQGKLDSMSFPGRKFTVFEFPVDFSHLSSNPVGDATWQLYHKACAPIYDGVTRPTLNWSITLRMKIRGLIGEKGSTTQTNDIICPFTLQPNQ